jgi:hypothetical protein
MTAEIAILNKHGLALAADSKVSISSPEGGKAYDSVNKVFTLSKYEPVGIMVFGSAEFMQTPWELVIKSYRDKIGKNKFNTIDEYAEDFLKFATNLWGVSSEDVDNNAKQILTSSLLEDLNLARSLSSERDLKIGSPAYINFLAEYFKVRTAGLMEKLYFDEFSEQLSIARRHRPQIRIVIRSLARYKSKQLNLVAKRYCYAVLFSQEFSSHASGIVVAGYGEQEYFPSIVEYSTDGIVDTTIKLVRKSITNITKEKSSCVRSFAQHDMVQSFMSGINGDLASVVFETFGDAMSDLTDAILDKYGTRKSKTASERAKIKTAVAKQAESVSEELWRFSHDNYVRPVIDMVALLPKDEMANLAESLVALTSLKRRVSKELETVGGPIDVAVISKGDGFIWIKRKHYFSRELNHHFAARYFEES